MELLALIIIIVMINSSGKKDREIAALKSTIKKLEQQLGAQTVTTSAPSYTEASPNNNVASVSNTSSIPTQSPVRKQVGVTFSGAPIYEDEGTVNNAPKEKKVHKEKELKNSLLLGTGAFLIIVAAFSFLYSTWDITSDFFKIGILVVIALMFFGMSRIARNKFKINQTADTFLYIGLAYVPVVLFSFSILNLIGDFFSISGAGKYIYLAACAFVVMVLYFALAIKNKDEKIYTAARVMRLAFIVLFTAIFSEYAKNIMAVLAVYSVILNVYKSNAIPLFKDIGVKISNHFTLIIGILSIIYTLATFGEVLSIVFLITVIVNGFILYARNEHEDIVSWSIPISISALPFVILNLDCITLEAIYTQVIHLVYWLAMFLLFNFKSTNLKNNFNIIALVHVFIIAAISELNDVDLLPGSLITTITMCMYLLLSYKKSDKHLELFAGATGINYFFLLCGFATSFDTTFSEVANTCLVVLTTILSGFIFRNNEGYKTIPTCGLLFFIMIFNEIFIGNVDLSFVIAVLATLTYTALSIFKRNSIVYTIGSFVFLLVAVEHYNHITNTYIQVALFIISSALQYLLTDKACKTTSLLTFVGSTLFLYQHVLDDLNLDHIIALTTIGYLIAGVFTTRYIIAKHTSSFKFCEYLLCILLYLNSFSAYEEPLDLLFFILMLAVVALASYKLKYGPVFLCSVIAIVVNTLYITAGFWFLIPWWGYLVATGIIILTFAMKNEIKENEKEKKQNIKTLWENTKEKLDL